MSAGNLEIDPNKGKHIDVEAIKLLTGVGNIYGMKARVTLLAGISEMLKYSALSKYT